jgi:hypothetical protein
VERCDDQPMNQPSDSQSRDEINQCFVALGSLIQQRQMPVEPGSDFALDEAQLPEPDINQAAWLLRFVALDHMESLRDHAALRPDGLARWHVHAPWTQLRAALETASHLVWMVGLDDRDTRLERLLRLSFDDNAQYKQALDLSHSPEKAAQVTYYDKIVQDFEAAAAPWTGKARNRIRTPINMVECVTESARLSHAVRLARTAELSWRIAAGYAHGSPWAHLSTGHLVDLGAVDERTTQYAGSIDLH